MRYVWVCLNLVSDDRVAESCMSRMAMRDRDHACMNMPGAEGCHACVWLNLKPKALGSGRGSVLYVPEPKALG